MSQEAEKPRQDEPVEEEKDPQTTEPATGDDDDEGMLVAELDDDDRAAATDEAVAALEGGVAEDDDDSLEGDLGDLAALTASDSFDAGAIAAGAEASPRPRITRRPQPQSSGLKSVAIFPLATVGLILEAFAVYGILILTDRITLEGDVGTTMPKVMVFAAGPLGLVLIATAVVLLLKVMDEKKRP